MLRRVIPVSACSWSWMRVVKRAYVRSCVSQFSGVLKHIVSTHCVPNLTMCVVLPCWRIGSNHRHNEWSFSNAVSALGYDESVTSWWKVCLLMLIYN